jgi:hypothetical protein
MMIAALLYALWGARDIRLKKEAGWVERPSSPYGRRGTASIM